MTANEEKNELVVVDVPNVHIYAFTVSGWPTPRTAEEVLNAARKSTAESIQRITQIIESGDYESDRGYWESRLAQEKARSYAVMTYGEWLDFEREKLLTPEMVEIGKIPVGTLQITGRRVVFFVVGVCNGIVTGSEVPICQ